MTLQQAVPTVLNLLFSIEKLEITVNKMKVYTVYRQQDISGVVGYVYFYVL